MNKRAWGTTVHGVTKSQTWLNDLSTNKHVLQLHELQPIWLLCPPLSPETEVAQLCLTLCDTMDCSLPGSSIHGIFQARVLEWVAISFSRGSSQTRDRILVSCTAGRHFTVWATRKALCSNSCLLSQWCCLTVLFSAARFSFCLQSFPVSASFPMSHLKCIYLELLANITLKLYAKSSVCSYINWKICINCCCC